MKYFGAIDQGTTSSRFIIFNEQGEIVQQHQEEFNSIYQMKSLSNMTQLRYGNLSFPVYLK